MKEKYIIWLFILAVRLLYITSNIGAPFLPVGVTLFRPIPLTVVTLFLLQTLRNVVKGLHRPAPLHT